MEHHSPLSYALGADNPRYTTIEVYKWVIYLFLRRCRQWKTKLKQI